MKILRQINFSKKEENAKMKLGDRINMSLSYAGMKEGSDKEKDERDRLRGKPLSEERRARQRRRLMVAEGGGGAIGGAIGAKIVGGSNKDAAKAAQ